MTRRYDDPVEVRRRDDVPAEFLWRDRLYVVRGVLDTWVETVAWWRTPAAAGVYGIGTATSDGGGGGLPAGGPARAAGPGPGEAPTGLALDQAEREMWRVEASAGRVHGTGVFELCFDWSAGRWTLIRAMD